MNPRALHSTDHRAMRSAVFKASLLCQSILISWCQKVMVQQRVDSCWWKSSQCALMVFSLCTKGSQRGKETAVKWKRSNAASVVKCVCAPLRICIISPDRERRVCVEGKALNYSVCKDLFSLGRRKGTLTNINGIPEYFKSYPHYLLFHL